MHDQVPLDCAGVAGSIRPSFSETGVLTLTIIAICVRLRRDDLALCNARRDREVWLGRGGLCGERAAGVGRGAPSLRQMPTARAIRHEPRGFLARCTAGGYPLERYYSRVCARQCVNPLAQDVATGWKRHRRREEDCPCPHRAKRGGYNLGCRLPNDALKSFWKFCL